MVRKFLPAVLVLTGTATLWGHNSKVFTKIQNEYSEVLSHNREEEKLFADQYLSIARQTKVLGNAIDNIIDGARLQMGRNGAKEGNLALGMECIDRMTTGSEIIKIEVFAKTIDLYWKVVHEKIRGKLLNFQVKITNYFDKMIAATTKYETKTSDSSYKKNTNKEFLNKVNKINNGEAKVVYLEIIPYLNIFKQQVASQNPLIIEPLHQLEDQVFECLCKILDLTNPNNYVREVEDAIREGLAAIDKEIEEEHDKLEQEELDEFREYSMPSDEQIEEEFEKLEQEELERQQAPVLTAEEIEKRRECDLQQTVLFEYYAAKKQLEELSSKIPDDTKIIRKMMTWHEELDEITKLENNANSGQLTRALMQIARIRRAAQNLETKLSKQNYVPETDHQKIEQQKMALELKKVIWAVIDKTNELMRKNYFSRKKSKNLYNKGEEDDFNKKIGQLKLKLRDNPSVDQLKMLLQLAEKHLFEAENDVKFLDQLDDVRS